MGLYFFSKLDWGSYMISIAKTVSKEIRVLIRSMKFISPEVILYLYKYTMRHFIECCCYIWVGSAMCYLYVVDKLHRRLCRTVGPTLAASFKPLGNCRNVASLILLYRYYFGGCSFDLTKPVPIPCSRRRSTHFSDRLHDFLSMFLNVTRLPMSTVSLFAQLDSGILCLQNGFLWPMI